MRQRPNAPASNRNSAAYSPRGRTGSVRSRVMGITSDGRLILRLPSGRTAIVAPDDEESTPRHRNRGYIDRDNFWSSARTWDRIISRTIETNVGSVISVRAQTGFGKRPATNDFYLKKSLPWFVISGIPRARAGTTNLLSTGNCIRFGNFQFRRASAGAWCRPHWGAKVAAMRPQTTWSR